MLIAAATQLGDTTAVAIFEQILAEEQDMADWLFDHMDETARIFLSRDELDLQAGR